MTGSYAVTPTNWGLHVRMQGELSMAQRDAAIAEIGQCFLNLRGRHWTSLIEFDHFQAENFRPERVIELVRLAQSCGHLRSAIVLTDWQWASTMADAMIAAGADDQIRIFVLPDWADEGCEIAMPWVLHGGVVPLVSQAA
jgi:hypothetical protein